MLLAAPSPGGPPGRCVAGRHGRIVTRRCHRSVLIGDEGAGVGVVRPLDPMLTAKPAPNVERYLIT